MSIEAMKQALEALDAYSWEQVDAARTALQQAIEQAEKQEGWVLREVYFSEGEPISHREPQPVAWANKKGQFKVHKEADETFKSTAIPFYAAPVHASDMSKEPVQESDKDRHEFAEIVKRGTNAWADTPDDWVDELRGGAEKQDPDDDIYDIWKEKTND